MNSSLSRVRVAYGLALSGLEGLIEVMPCARPGGPAVRVERRVEPGPVGVRTRIDGERATVRLGDGGCLVMARRARTATFRTPVALPDAALVHPCLAWIGSAFARWHGREAFHGGALALAGGAWGILGGKGAGKSTLLAHLAQGGCAVVSDDLLVVAGDSCFAGPRCVDLREESAAHLERADGADIVRSGEHRRRLRLPAVAAELPLKGWVFLEWGEEDALVRLPPRRRLELLQRHLALFTPTEPAALLDLASLPAWELRRRRSWASLEVARKRLLEVAAD